MSLRIINVQPSWEEPVFHSRRQMLFQWAVVSHLVGVEILENQLYFLMAYDGFDVFISRRSNPVVTRGLLHKLKFRPEGMSTPDSFASFQMHNVTPVCHGSLNHLVDKTLA